MAQLSEIKRNAKRHTKSEIRRILKEIEKDAIDKLDKALTCGALSEESEFMNPNQLLAAAMIEIVSVEYQLRSANYRKELANLNCFI